MTHPVNFYSVIIGTELLNGRRKDAHFAFLNQELLQRNWKHKASFVISDDPLLMENTFNLIKKDPHSVMFCFGGIGATPDDLTRQVAAKVFSHNKMHFHEEAKLLIENQFGKEAYPHRINMSYLPCNAKLLDNVVNNVPGFYLKERFFFTPGFPSMSQAMVIQALDTYYNFNEIHTYVRTLTAHCGENDLIEVMQRVPASLELSSLPKIIGNKRKVVISLRAENEEEIKEYFELFIHTLKKKHITYELKDSP